MSKPSYNQPTHPVTWLTWPQHPTLPAPPDSTAIKPYTLKLPPSSLATPPLSCTPSSLPPLLAAEVLDPLVHPQPGMATIPLPMNEPYMVLIIYEWPLPILTHASCVYAPTTKMSGALPATPCNIDFNNINHIQFLSATLKAHGLENSYQLTNHGPPFRIWWKGLEGGRGSAFTIRTNREFKRIQKLILSKPPLATPVSVLYWEDDMVPFLISMKTSPRNNLHTEENHGLSTKIIQPNAKQEFPHFPGLRLKPKGYQPYLVPCGKKPKKCFPMSSPDTCAHPTMPHLCQSVASPVHKASNKTHPLMRGFVDVQQTRGNYSSGCYPFHLVPTNPSSTTNFPERVLATGSSNTPSAPGSIQTMKMTSNPMVYMSSLAIQEDSISLPLGVIISTSISNFQKYSGVDISEAQEYLEHHELTPNVIYAVPYQHLANILKVTKEKALKYQLFCQEFSNQLNP